MSAERLPDGGAGRQASPGPSPRPGRPAAADEAAILDGIAEVARLHLGWTGEVRPDQRLIETLALDSLRSLTLVVEIENRFRIRLDEEGAGGIETVGDLMRTVRRKLEEAEA